MRSVITTLLWFIPYFAYIWLSIKAIQIMTPQKTGNPQMEHFNFDLRKMNKPSGLHSFLSEKFKVERMKGVIFSLFVSFIIGWVSTTTLLTFIIWDANPINWFFAWLFAIWPIFALMSLAIFFMELSEVVPRPIEYAVTIIIGHVSLPLFIYFYIFSGCYFLGDCL